MSLQVMITITGGWTGVTEDRVVGLRGLGYIGSAVRGCDSPSEGGFGFTMRDEIREAKARRHT